MSLLSFVSKMKVIIVSYTITILFYQVVNARKCYDCSCNYNWATNTGSCASSDFQTNCALNEHAGQFCKILSYYDGDSEVRYFQAASLGYYQDSHFFEAVESISFSNSVWGSATFKTISYGCDWDGCNNPSLGQFLPRSFQMNINPTILSSALLGAQSTTPNCYSCIACINGITATLCQQQSCGNGICYIDEIHNYVASAQNNCTYYYTSACLALSGPPSIQIRAVYYIDLPAEKQLEIDEVDIRCTQSLCNSVETVEYLKGQIQVAVNIDAGFQPNRPGDASTIIIQKIIIAFSFFLLFSLL